MALLLAKKKIIPVKYLDFADIFLEKSVTILLKQTGENKYPIKLKEDKQPAYKTIYSLKLVKLETFKTYIKTSLANSFILVLKLSAFALILFLCKLNSSFCLCVNYCELNNLTIKNYYPLSLIGESLDWLG